MVWCVEVENAGMVVVIIHYYGNCGGHLRPHCKVEGANSCLGRGDGSHPLLQLVNP